MSPTPRALGFQGYSLYTELELVELISNKIRINPFPNRVMQIPERDVFFYRNYSFFVRKTLREPLFQRFLRWLLKREKINNSVISGIQIKVLPFQKKNGNKLAGKWNRHGNILIFPVSFELYRKLVLKHGKEIARSYAKSRACATLIHEILHAKYSNDEERVRRLTERYFSIYARNPKTEDFESVIFEILFGSRNEA